MNHQKLELYFLLIFLVGIFILAFFIFKPFFYSIILAMVFATVFEPLHKKVLSITRQKKNLAALLTTFIVLVVVITPITFLGIQVFQETTQLYSFFTQNDSTVNFSNIVRNAISSLEKFFHIPLKSSIDFNQYFKQGLSWMLQQLGPLFANVAKIILNIFIFLVALYYLFKDGQKLRVAVINLSPLRNIHDKTILNKLALAVNSVARGSLTMAFIQGILTAVGFVIFRIPNPALWGSAAAIAALIPGIGTSLVIIPAVLFLFFSGKLLFAIGFLLWGMTAVGLIDNFLGPKLIGRGTQLHPFLILLSIFGGIIFFGPFGFLLGPLILSLLFALIEIYFTVSKEHKNNLA